MSHTPTPTDRLIAKLDEVMERLEEVRHLHSRMDKIALFLEQVRFTDFVENYSTPRKVLLTNFLAGLARGLGLTIGTAIVLTLFGAIVSKFLSIPYVGEYIKQIVDYVNSYNRGY